VEKVHLKQGLALYLEGQTDSAGRWAFNAVNIVLAVGDSAASSRSSIDRVIA
jgi:hypothetical protein